MAKQRHKKEDLRIEFIDAGEMSREKAEGGMALLVKWLHKDLLKELHSSSEAPAKGADTGSRDAASKSQEGSDCHS